MPQSLAALTLFFLLGLPFFVGTGLLAVPDIPPFSFYSALHSAVEIFTVAVAILVFAMGFHLLEKKRPTALFVLASAFLGVALLDFLHLISHSGLPDFFTTNTPHKATILTHCNTGALATAGWGTALGVIKEAFYSGKDIFAQGHNRPC